MKSKLEKGALFALCLIGTFMAGKVSRMDYVILWATFGILSGCGVILICETEISELRDRLSKLKTNTRTLLGLVPEKMPDTVLDKKDIYRSFYTESGHYCTELTELGEELLAKSTQKIKTRLLDGKEIMYKGHMISFQKMTIFDQGISYWDVEIEFDMQSKLDKQYGIFRG